MGLMGLAMGAIDCMVNLQLVLIYDKAVAPFLQVTINLKIEPAISSNTYVIRQILTNYLHRLHKITKQKITKTETILIAYNSHNE